MIEKNDYFEWSDAWVFLSLSNYDNEFKHIELSNIIGCGDALNHSIFSPNELRQGFKKLYAKGLIEIRGNEIRITDLGIEVKTKVSGGMFSLVDNCLNRLNSKRLKFRDIDIKADLPQDFLSDKAIEEGYRKYKTFANND